MGYNWEGYIGVDENIWEFDWDLGVMELNVWEWIVWFVYEI